MSRYGILFLLSFHFALCDFISLPISLSNAQCSPPISPDSAKKNASFIKQLASFCMRNELFSHTVRNIIRSSSHASVPSVQNRPTAATFPTDVFPANVGSSDLTSSRRDSFMLGTKKSDSAPIDLCSDEFDDGSDNLGLYDVHFSGDINDFSDVDAGVHKRCGSRPRGELRDSGKSEGKSHRGRFGDSGFDQSAFHRSGHPAGFTNLRSNSMFGSSSRRSKATYGNEKSLSRSPSPSSHASDSNPPPGTNSLHRVLRRCLDKDFDSDQSDTYNLSKYLHFEYETETCPGDPNSSERKSCKCSFVYLNCNYPLRVFSHFVHDRSL